MATIHVETGGILMLDGIIVTHARDCVGYGVTVGFGGHLFCLRAEFMTILHMLVVECIIMVFLVCWVVKLLITLPLLRSLLRRVLVGVCTTRVPLIC